MNRIGAFLLGGTIGALAALAFAPRKGSEIREIVVERANSAVSNAPELASSLPGRAQEAFKGATETASGLVNNVQAKVTGNGNADSADMEELRAKIEEARQRIAEKRAEQAAE